MSKSKRMNLILSLLMGGSMIMTACAKETKTVDLSYPPQSGENMVVSTALDFSEADLIDQSGEYNAGVAKLCAVMSASAFSGAIPQENFHELGFSHIAKFSYDKGYEEDKVGVIAASKNIAGETLIFVVARGTQGKEWYSNFDVGFEPEHKGFSGCADFLFNKLDLYMTNYMIDSDKARFLITGYSRGAAAANILSKRLIDAYSGERVQAYTFATPNTTTLENDERYSSIFNIVKSDDVFTGMPLSSWGYHRYGTDIVLEESDKEPAQVRQVFQEITGDDFRGFESSEDTKSFLTNAYQLAPTVKDYYEKKYTVGEYSLPGYEYMNIAAKFLCEEHTEDDGDILIESMDSPFSDVSMFFMQGVDMEELLFSGSFERSSVADSHSMVSYLILMNDEQ